MGLLEVVPGDLFELRRPVAVDAIGPLHEPLMKHCTCALEQAVVDAIPDQNVVEAVQAPRLCPDELLSRELVETLVDLVTNKLLDELVHGRLLEVVADNRGGIDHRT